MTRPRPARRGPRPPDATDTPTPGRWRRLAARVAAAVRAAHAASVPF